MEPALDINLWSTASEPARDAELIELALGGLVGALRSEVSPLWEAVPDPHVQTRIGGGMTVRLRQQYAGIPVVGHQLVVDVAADGTIAEARGQAVAIERIAVVPATAVEEALRIAFSHLKSKSGPESPCSRAHLVLVARSKRWRPRTLGSFAHPARPALFNRGPFDRHPTAELALVDSDSGFRLSWNLRFVLAGDEVEIAVAADDRPELLSCAYLNRSATCFGPVFVFNPGDEVVERAFPMPLNEYPRLLATHPYSGHFKPWVAKAESSGNNVVTFARYKRTTCKVTQQAGRSIFSPKSDAEQQLVNAFYFCNWLHDLLLLLGFSEAEGNFQLQNYLTAAGAGDPLHVKVFPTPIDGGGKMLAHADSIPAELRLGTWPKEKNRKGRPAALDADIIIHEFFHGVTQRLVGGRLDWSSLYEPQSAAMGEGWSDYFAVTLQNYYRPQPRYTFASWVSERPEGIRSQPYDMTFQGHYGLLGKAPHIGDHGAGEVWAAALIRWHVHLARPLGSISLAHQIGWLLVIDSLKSVPRNPSFLQGRDALFEGIAARAAAHVFDPNLTRELERATWSAFAELGMGRNAKSAGTSITSGIVADFTH